MDMKGHILAALREEFEQWEELLGGLSEKQMASPLLPSLWTVKNVIAHLYAWQLRTRARCEAALHDRPPEFPNWPEELDPETDDVDEINAWIYETYRAQPWPQVHQNWREGFQRILELAGGVSEIDMLDSVRYPFLHGYSLAFILIASYDHHKEHLEKLQAWLADHFPKGIEGA